MKFQEFTIENQDNQKDYFQRDQTDLLSLVTTPIFVKQSVGFTINIREVDHEIATTIYLNEPRKCADNLEIDLNKYFLMPIIKTPGKQLLVLIEFRIEMEFFFIVIII